jgi:hypothetical protein
MLDIFATYTVTQYRTYFLKYSYLCAAGKNIIKNRLSHCVENVVPSKIQF